MKIQVPRKCITVKTQLHEDDVIQPKLRLKPPNPTSTLQNSRIFEWVWVCVCAEGGFLADTILVGDGSMLYDCVMRGLLSRETDRLVGFAAAYVELIERIHVLLRSELLIATSPNGPPLLDHRTRGTVWLWAQKCDPEGPRDKHPQSSLPSPTSCARSCRHRQFAVVRASVRSRRSNTHTTSQDVAICVRSTQLGLEN